ncbi:MAG: UDP-N-acetylglucosamine--N-acetylmuramyl-(pentapeptide) pyrophosphoryl-undecaprenol N-acetylglucosamine transferase, partial [Crocinitomicaceae bacterium]|nr:UDP-N-acetylglucosamine--N-acetylmuramyl-(pentapeptide) pyrophosphoryl-undecaprenol N-acetylglucosamine transferase [Crocinitomicaceae bacterium]
VGVGGYASGPLLRAAASMNISTLIQEQNSFPGITNKLLSRKASKICVAYQGLEKWFPKERIVFTGNPVRPEMTNFSEKRESGITHFGLIKGRPTLLVIGGSLGAWTINEAVRTFSKEWINQGLQIIWQTGKSYEKTAHAFSTGISHLSSHTFIKEMDIAYAVADIIISRAGAMSISELCLVGKPSVLIPSPNVSEDHQTKNAMALVNQHAAIIVRDAEAGEKLGAVVSALAKSEKEMSLLSQNILQLGTPNAAKKIADEVLSLVR